MNSKDAYRLMHEGALAFGRAELNGMRVDMHYIFREKRRLTHKINKIVEELDDYELIKDWKKRFAGKYNINSGHQLREIIYKQYKCTAKKTTKGGYGSTDEETLRQLNVPGIDKLLRMRKLLKIRDTYLEAYEREQVDGYIHPFFNLNTVVTFRSSSDRPNFQNIPKRDREAMKSVRDAIYARPGHQLMEMDFSKLEVSIASCYHKDPVMMRYLKSEHNDLHGDLAAQIFKIKNFDRHLAEHSFLRSATKNGFVFPQFYGDYYAMNAEGLRKWVQLPTGKWKQGQGIKMPGDSCISDHLIKNGIGSFGAFTNHIQDVEFDFWNNRFKVYKRWKDKWVATYKRKGYFDSLTGFRYTGIMKRNQVINYPVQGAAFHCLLWVFIQMDRWLRQNEMATRIIGQIHDAIVMDVHSDELEKVYRQVRQFAMVELPAAWDWIIAPLSIDAEITDVDCSWATKHEYEPK